MGSVEYHWKTSLNVGALVTLVAAVHYFYMREFWVQLGSSPILYRYIDWSITVPLQMVEFLLHPFCGEPQHRRHDVLALVPWHPCYVGCGLRRRSWVLECLAWLHCRLVWMGLHLLRSLRRRGRVHGSRRQCGAARGFLFQHHACHCHGRLEHLSSRLLLRLLDGWC